MLGTVISKFVKLNEQYDVAIVGIVPLGYALVLLCFLLFVIFFLSCLFLPVLDMYFVYVMYIYIYMCVCI